MPAQETFAQQLRDDIRDEKIALLLGTGFSTASAPKESVTSWVDLLQDGLDFIGSLNPSLQDPAEQFRKMLQAGPETDLLITIAEWLRRKFSPMPGEYHNWLTRTVGSLRPCLDSPLHKALPPARHILTTNYDVLASTLLGRKAITWTMENAENEYQRKAAGYVFHVHGLYSDPRSVILSGEDYGRLQENGTSFSILTNIARHSSLVLVGYGQGLNDPNFQKLVEWFRENQRHSEYRHYILIREQELEQVEVVHQLGARLTPVVYGSEHSDLPDFLLDLADTPHDNSSGTKEVAELIGYSSLLAAELPSAVEAYIEEQLGSVDSLNDFQTRALTAMAAAAKTSTPLLVCAVTGTGKTTISRVAINVALANKTSGIELLPTKALVHQEVEEWTRWAEVWEHNSDRRIRVYGSSRDYPENDRPVSRGRYDVALAIFEKLGIYIVSGRTPLQRSSVAVFDELQMLLERSGRAEKLEAILMCLRMMPEGERPSIIGLSAALSLESTKFLTQWLGIRPADVISSNQRPIPLDAYVVDPVGQKVQSDAHLLNMPGEAPPAASAYTHHGLDATLKERQPLLRGKVPHVPQGELAAILIDSLIEADPNRKIICFVPSRTAAIELSTAVQRLWTVRMGRLEKGSPWSVGRFATGEIDEAESDLRYMSLRHSDIPNADSVVRGLLHGVAAHSASFTAALRRLLEDEFRRSDGLLRVLIATDTLAVGVNLPADTVIATSISGFSGTPRSRRLLDPSNLDNKAGRAGRLGRTARKRGEFYLLVPSQSDLQSVSDVGAMQLEELSTVEGVFDAYIANTSRVGVIRSNYRTVEQMAMLVLIVLCQDGFARGEVAWSKRVRKILDSSLLAVEDPGLLPTVDSVREALLERKLIRNRPNGKIALTGLGMALARASVDLNSSQTLERLARLVSANAGDIDVLWNACRSSAIQSATEWVSLPPVPQKHYPSLKEAVIRAARAYCEDSENGRRRFGRLSEAGKYPPPEAFVEAGSIVVSPELRALLLSDGESAGDADVTALLRALIAYEWSKGVPFAQIKARYTANIVSEERHDDGAPVALKVHYSDVEQLCEQIAGLINSASDVCVSLDGLDYSSRARTLAQEVEIGLPAWVGPIVRMRIPALHRERLTFLWDQTPPSDHIADVLDRPEITGHIGITEDEIADARRKIGVRAEEERAYRNRIAQRWGVVFVPGGEGRTFDDVSDDLDEAGNVDEYARSFSDLMQACGLQSRRVKPELQNFLSIRVSGGEAYIDLFFPSGELLRVEDIARVRSEQGIVILRTPTAPGAFVSDLQPSRVRFLQPEHILSVLASLVDARDTALEAGEIIETLGRVFVSSVDSDRWFLATSDGMSGPPPFTGDLPALDATFAVPHVDDDTTG